MKKMVTACMIAALAASALRAQDAAETAGAGADVEVQKDLLTKWIETRQLVSKERADWRTGKSLLEDRIDMLQRQIEVLGERTKEAEAGIGEADDKLGDLTDRNDALKAATDGLGDSIARLEARLRGLLDRVPDPLSDRVRPLSQRMPDPDKEIKMSLSERFQNVIGVLNEINKFSREITVASEVRELEGEAGAEVSVVYLGLGQAYYTNVKGGLGGVGRPGDQGWEWIPRDELSELVADVIAIHRNEKPAGYILLPFEQP
jgi:hypothetical protein